MVTEEKKEREGRGGTPPRAGHVPETPGEAPTSPGRSMEPVTDEDAQPSE